MSRYIVITMHGYTYIGNLICSMSYGRTFEVLLTFLGEVPIFKVGVMKKTVKRLNLLQDYEFK